MAQSHTNRVKYSIKNRRLKDESEKCQVQVKNDTNARHQTSLKFQKLELLTYI